METSSLSLYGYFKELYHPYCPQFPTLANSQSPSDP